MSIPSMSQFVAASSWICPRSLKMASRMASAALLALAVAFFAEGAIAYHTALLPHTHFATVCRRMSSLRGPRGGALTMSFVPDKKAVEQNFAKVPDAIVLRDPVQLEDSTTKVLDVLLDPCPSSLGEFPD